MLDVLLAPMRAIHRMLFLGWIAGRLMDRHRYVFRDTADFAADHILAECLKARGIKFGSDDEPWDVDMAHKLADAYAKAQRF